MQWDTQPISLVLGGGGGRGLAHVGAWRALQEQGVRPERVVGSSVGALIGASIAAGAGWGELTAKALRLARGSVFSLDARILYRGASSRGLLRAEPLRALIRELIPVSRFEDLAIPLSINAISLESGEVVWFGEGGRMDVPLADAVYASCALPFLFPPAAIGGGLFVDGGIIDPLPVQRARSLGSHEVIAVDLASDAQSDPLPVGLLDTYRRMFQILRPVGEQVADERLLRIHPPMSGQGTFDLSKAENMIEGGYRASTDALRGRGWHRPTPDIPAEQAARDWRLSFGALLSRSRGRTGERLSPV